MKLFCSCRNVFASWFFFHRKAHNLLKMHIFKGNFFVSSKMYHISNICLVSTPFLYYISVLWGIKWLWTFWILANHSKACVHISTAVSVVLSCWHIGLRKCVISDVCKWGVGHFDLGTLCVCSCSKTNKKKTLIKILEYCLISIQ